MEEFSNKNRCLAANRPKSFVGPFISGPAKDYFYKNITIFLYVKQEMEILVKRDNYLFIYSRGNC